MSSNNMYVQTVLTVCIVKQWFSGKCVKKLMR